MSDFVITGDTQNAVNALVKLEQQTAKTERTLDTFKGKLVGFDQVNKKFADSFNATAISMYKAQEQAKLLAAAVDNLRKSDPEYKRRVADINTFATSLSRTSNTLKMNARETESFQSKVDQLRNALIKTGANAQDALRALTLIKQGRSVDHYRDKLGSLLPLLRSINATVEATIKRHDQETQAIQRKSNAILKQKLLANQAARAFSFSTGLVDPKQFQNASQGEAARLQQAQAQLSKLLAASKYTTSRMQEMWKMSADASAQGWDLASTRIIAAMRRVRISTEQLGASARTEAAKLTALHERSARQALTTYNATKKGLEGVLLTWQSIVRLATIQILHSAFGQLTRAVGEANRELLDLQTKIAQIRTISLEAQLTTEQWTQGVLRLAAAFGKSNLDVAAGAYFSISNQIAKGAETLTFLNEALIFSQVAVTTTEDAVNLLSGAMKSFNLETSDARRVAAQFMTTVELGRVLGEELADTIGRVGPLFDQVGGKMEELNAFMAITTQRGIRYNEAMTLINNVMLKLVKPTEDMQELFNKWGVTSGQAAVATFGVAGVLEKLGEAAKESGDAMAFLGGVFSRIRAIRGGALFTDPRFLEEWKEGVDLIGNSLGRYEVQVKNAFETQTFTIKQASQQFKNFVLQNMSRPLVEYVANMIKSGNDFVTIFQKVRASLEPLVLIGKAVAGIIKAIPFSLQTTLTALIALRAALKFFGPSLKFLGLAVTGIATQAVGAINGFILQSSFASAKLEELRVKGQLAFGQIKISAQAAAVAVKAFQVATQLAVGAAIAIVSTIVFKFIQARAELRLISQTAAQEVKYLLESLKEATDQTTEIIENQLEIQRVNWSKSLDNRFLAYKQFIARLRSETLKVQEFLTQSFDNAFKLLASTINDSVTEMRKAVSETERMLSKIVDRLEEIPEKRRDFIREAADKTYRNALEAVKDKSPRAQLSVAADREAALRDELSKTSNPEKALEVVNDIESVLDDQRRILSDSRGFLQQRQELEEKTNRLLTERLNILSREEETLKGKEVDAKIQEATLGKFENQLERLRELVRDTKITDLTSPEVVNQAKSNFEKAVTELQELLQTKLGSDFLFSKTVQTNTAARIDEVRESFKEALDSAETLTNAQQALNNIQKSSENQEKKIAELRDKVTAAETARQDFINLIAPLIKESTKSLVDKKLPLPIEASQKKIAKDILAKGGFSGAITKGQFGPDKIDFKVISTNISDLISELKKARPEEQRALINELNNKFLTVQALLNTIAPISGRYYKGVDSNPTIGEQGAGGETPPTLADIGSAVQEALRNLNSAEFVAEKASKEITALIAENNKNRSQALALNARISEIIGYDVQASEERQKLIEALNNLSTTILEKFPDPGTPRGKILPRLRDSFEDVKDFIPSIPSLLQELRTLNNDVKQLSNNTSINITIEGASSPTQTAEAVGRELILLRQRGQLA